MPVAAVRAGNVVVALQRLADSDGDGFFANVEVGQSRHLGRNVKFVYILLEQPDLDHLLVRLEPFLQVNPFHILSRLRHLYL
jgi:hypothetical protein